MFQFPGFAFVTYVFSHKYFHMTPAMQNTPTIEPKLNTKSAWSLQRSEVGCPIRKFTDQSLFAAPHDLSQRTTSFIASQHQGIHRIPLRHLIALIINTHRTLSKAER